jgi:hypothetical protein
MPGTVEGCNSYNRQGSLNQTLRAAGTTRTPDPGQRRRKI